MKIAYLFTTFPELSERFLQREIEAMRELGVELEIFSLFRGGGDFRGVPVRRFRWWEWAGLPLAFAREYRRNPAVFRAFFRELRRGRPAGAINVAETLLGFGFAVIRAERFRRSGGGHVHAVWATGPATAAYLLRGLSGPRFTFGAHAYDVFRDGGDWILGAKLRAAALIHTSTEATRKELLRLGAPADRVAMIRRGLTEFPEMKPWGLERGGEEPIRILSVGRLIEKKGFDDLLRICAALRAAEVPFLCRIVGGGPLMGKLKALRDSLGLEDFVYLTGAQPYGEVMECYRWADVFCFTGRIAADDDRDGLPNVIAEAMAFGVPVLAAPVSGTVEAIRDGATGYLLEPGDSGAWVAAIRRLRADDGEGARLRRAARDWVEANFDARENAARLLAAFTAIRGEANDQAIRGDVLAGQKGDR